VIRFRTYQRIRLALFRRHEALFGPDGTPALERLAFGAASPTCLVKRGRSRWIDVLVHVKEVPWIELGLQVAESRIVGPIHFRRRIAHLVVVHVIGVPA